jgi:flagellar biosynthesis GTPase FlhF
MSEAAPNPAQVPPDAGTGTAEVKPTAAQPEAKPQADQKPLSEPAKSGEQPQPEKPVVPEKYDLKLPENAQIKADQLEKIAQYAKEQGFSQEQAQKYLERENQVLSEFQQAQQDGLKTQTKAWVESAQADKEYGGEKFKENLELARRALSKFAPQEFVKVLDETGLGNHPELIRTFFRIGNSMKDDRIVNPGAQNSAGKTAAEVLYGGAS